MITKSILTALLLCSAYSAVACLNLDSDIRPINQRQGNLVKCQEYIFRDSIKADYVITGSSMAYRLRQEFLPRGYYNLAIGGHSSFLGLELVNRSSNLPKVVFIEMNTILRSNNTTFVNEIFERPSYDIKKHVVITRDKFQFFPFLVNKTQQCLSPGGGTDNSQAIDKATLQKRINLHKNKSSELPDEKRLEKSFERLHKLVAELENKNIGIVFFEMPMHVELRNGGLFLRLKTKFEETFPPNKYLYVFTPDSEKYTTTDGIHLVASSAKEMADYLVTQFASNED